MAECRSSEDVIGSGDSTVWEDVVGEMWVALCALDVHCEGGVGKV